MDDYEHAGIPRPGRTRRASDIGGGFRFLQKDFHDLIIASCWLAGGDEAKLTRFISWSNCINLNLFWWQITGCTLAVVKEDESKDYICVLRFSGKLKMTRFGPFRF